VTTPFVPGRAISALFACVVATACGGGGTSPVQPQDPAIASATIGPEGGQVVFADGPHAGIGVSIPAGALTAPTPIELRAHAPSDAVLGLFPVFRVEPRGLPLLAPASVIVRAAPQLAQSGGGLSATCLLQPRLADAWQPLPTTVVDGGARTVAASTTWLGDFAALNASLHRLFTQPFALLDPASPTRAETIEGGAAVFAAGSVVLTVGRGSLASFWNSPAAANVLVLPGLFGSPVDYLGSADLVAALPPSVQNVVVLSYPSGRGVAATANALYDLIAARQQAGFGCAIVGHSMGGLVGRYLVEQSHADALRSGWQAGAPSLASAVAHLVLIGVPNAGCDIGEQLVATMVVPAPSSEQHKVQAALDLSYRSDAITARMNALYADNATRYHVVYGDLGGGDGVVTVASALALPLGPGETAMAFPTFHDALHALAAINGVAAHVVALLQAP